MIEQIFATMCIRIHLQSVTERNDCGIVATNLIVCVSVDVCLLVQTPSQVLCHILKQYQLLALGIVCHILRYGDDSEVRGATLFNICFAYWKIGKQEKEIVIENIKDLISKGYVKIKAKEEKKDNN